jgi:hypothetical protein
LTFVVPSVKPALSAIFSESCTAKVPAFVTAAVPRFAVTVPLTGCVTAEPSTLTAPAAETVARWSRVRGRPPACTARVLRAEFVLGEGRAGDLAKM